MNPVSYIYFDNASTTKIDDEVIESMIPYMSDFYGNASSTHSLGLRLKKDIDASSKIISELINCESKEIIYTSGATESINTILKSICYSNHGKRNQIVTLQTEHSAVLDTCKYLESQGYEVSYLPVRKDGLVDLEILKANVSEKTLAVCVMMVNNETGVIQPIEMISSIVHLHNAYFFVDGTQALGKLEVDVVEMGIDFLAFSAHKFHGPKGIGGFYIKNTFIKSFVPYQHGGGHQKGLRSGTLNVPGIIGMGKACEILLKNKHTTVQNITELRDLLERELLEVEGAFLNGNKLDRVCSISNICFPGVDADLVISMLGNICTSNGSACSSSLIQPSHVLKSMGLSDNDAFSSIRFSLSKYNTKEEVLFVAKRLKEIINQIT